MFRELGLHSTTTRPRVRPRERWRGYVSLLAFEGLTTSQVSEKEQMDGF